MSTTATQQPTRGLVEIRDVRKAFGPHEVLRGINLTIEPGEVVAILGPSGSGKSTLLRTINHLEKLDGGTIAIDGELMGYRVRANQLHELREREVLRQRTHVGMVFQHFNLFPHLTALQNITEAPVNAQGRPRAEATEHALGLLRRVGLEDRAGAYPRQLSGGQQQRVAIARAIVSDPAILICDEPTGDLDRASAEEILGLLQTLNREHGKTIVMVTHDPKAAEYATHTLHLDKGNLVEQIQHAA